MLSLLAAAYFLRADDPSDFLNWGKEALDVIKRDYWLPDLNLYSEYAGSSKPAFDWGVGVLIPAFDAATAADRPSFFLPLLSYLDRTRTYWNPAGPVPGYDVLPMPKPKDRYYDDNEWMVMGLVEASDVLHMDQYLDEAKRTFKFVKSGWDDKLGGGVYWRESDKASKNTCSNGPATADALALYQATKQQSYLDFAKADYDWTKNHLRDPADGLYWDNVNLAGRIGRAKFSYNSALMLRSAVDLYRATNEYKYADDARALLDASLQHWIGPDGAFKDDGKFGFLLTEAWLRTFKHVPRATDPTAAIDKALRIVHDRCRDATGHYGNRWDATAPAEGYSKPMLIDQAAAARAFFELYLAEKGK